MLLLHVAAASRTCIVSMVCACMTLECFELHCATPAGMVKPCQHQGKLVLSKFLLLFLLQGYSTLGSQWLMRGFDHNPVLTHPAVVKAAADAQRSPAQVVLRWALQHGQVSALRYHAIRHGDPSSRVALHGGKLWQTSNLCTKIWLTLSSFLSFPFLSFPFLSFPLLSFPLLSCPLLSCPLLSCLVLSCLVLSCLVLSCLVLSCLVLSCLLLSCLVLSCLVFPLLASHVYPLALEPSCCMSPWIPLDNKLAFMFDSMLLTEASKNARPTGHLLISDCVRQYSATICMRAQQHAHW